MGDSIAKTIETATAKLGEWVDPVNDWQAPSPWRVAVHDAGSKIANLFRR
jgi:hypothetical protein